MPSISLPESPRPSQAFLNASGSSFDIEQKADTMQYSSPGSTPSFIPSAWNFLSWASVLGGSPPRWNAQVALDSLFEADLSFISPISSPMYFAKVAVVKTSAQATCLPIGTDSWILTMFDF